MRNFFSLVSITLLLLLPSSEIFAQFSVSITITDAQIETDCFDFLSAPDLVAGVSIAGSDFEPYEPGNNCFSDFPNLQFQEVFTCLTVPTEIEICFQAYENDPSIFNPCQINPDCLVEICETFPIPTNEGDTPLTITIPPGGESEGTVSFVLSTLGSLTPINDLPCDALDAGVVNFGESVGDIQNSVFNNFCGTLDNEPNQTAVNGFFNNNGVWFKFTTGANPGAVHKITGISDPGMLGDQVSLQIALAETSNGDCSSPNSIDGGSDFNGSDLDEFLLAYCLEPETEYHILVDGGALSGAADSDSLFGYFGLEVKDVGAITGADLICDAEALGVIPDGDSVTSPLMSNGCATNTNDPTVSLPGAGFLFNSKGVWVSFMPPATGHVTIDVIADPTNDDEMNAEFAVFASSDGTCNAPFSTISITSNSNLASESVTLPCLNPDQTYWILIDGQGASATRSGIFEVVVTDAGENTPVFDQVVTLCSDEDLVVGLSVYDESGMYSDTLILANGCDSIVNTDLTVLPELVLDIDINQPGINEGVPNGIATALVSGGDGDYSFAWSHGETTAQVNNLIGETEYCVTVTDATGCAVDTCFIQPLVINLIPIIPNDSLDCNGDFDGILSISAFAGLPPYDFSWVKVDDPTVNASGQLQMDFEVINFSNLTAGFYSVSISDSNFDTIVVAEIWEPDTLSLSQINIVDNSCFDACDGSIDIEIAGGTAPYQTLWFSNASNGLGINNVCAGEETVSVLDANGCSNIFSFVVNQPAEIIANGIEVQAVSCFQGADGVASVTVTNATNPTFLWENGETNQTIDDLAGGTYQVTITNEDGCTTVANSIVTTPIVPLGVSILETANIICGGSNEGALEAVISGPGNTITYEWSNGITGPFLSELEAGMYAVTVTNENGCTAATSFELEGPPEIFAELSSMGVTCYGGLNDGVIFIDTVVGGVPPYTFSATGFGFTDLTAIEGLTAGQQTLFVKDDFGCVRGFEVLIENVPDIQVDLGTDLRLELGDSIQLNSSVSFFDLTYTWEADQLLSCFDCPNPMIQPTQNTTLQVTVFDEESGCSDTDELFIEVVKNRKFYTANVFSPNNDGINDFFFVQGGPDVRLVRSFMVFDRNGGQVFENGNFLPNDFSQGWNGVFNGKTMNAGVFAWFAEVEFLDGAVEIYRGDVTLLK